MKKEKSTLKVLNYSSISFFCLMIFFGYGGGEAVADILGDVNGDVTVNSTDALIILSCDVGMDTAGFCPMNCGDVNADGMVNSTDALIVLSNDVGISVPFPIGEPECPSSVTPCPGCTVTARPPNILLIIADDVGMDVATGMYPGLITGLLSQYGPDGGHNHPNYAKIDGRPASTPVLDQLAQEGKVFSNTWAQPFCSPTRATIITGMFAAKTNVKTFDTPMSISHTTFVERLRDEANYSTAIFGKWHLAGGHTTGYNNAMPQMMGFEIFKGNLDSAPTPGYWDHYYHVQDGDTVDPAATPPNGPTPSRSLPGIGETTYAPVVRAADTVEWITAKEAENPNKPWFAWLAFNQAHVTLDYPLYHVPNEDTMDGPTMDEIFGCGGVPGNYYSGNEGGCTPAQLMRAMTNSMDTVIGKVLDAVDSLDSDTYVIFIGDNGTWSNNLDNMYITISGRGKTTPYESGARVPMAIRGPGITANSRSDEFVHAADLFSTCLQLAGLEVAPEGLDYLDYTGSPAELDGVSLTPILFDTASSVRDPDHGYLLEEVGWNGNKVGARNATYKVICLNNTSNSSCTFYNLIDDPLEEYPLSKPDSCTNYTNGTWTPEADPGWHYCRLIEVIDLYSIIP